MGELTCYTTRLLNNGWRVAARVVNGQLEAYKFANIKQANTMRDKLNSGDTVPTALWMVTPGRPFFVRLDQLVRQKCESCGVNYADPPSKLCPGCEAYQDHQQ